MDLLAEAIEAAKTGAVDFETLLRSVSQTCLDAVKMSIPKHLQHDLVEVFKEVVLVVLPSAATSIFESAKAR